MVHALELGFETRPQTGALDPRLGARIPVVDAGYEFGELGALGGLAVETILRRDGEHGAVVVLARRDVPAAAAELARGLTGNRCALQRALDATLSLETGSRLFMS